MVTLTQLLTMLYDLRDGSNLTLPKTKSLRIGINSLQFRGSLLWNNLPMSTKNCQSLNEFKLELKNLGNIKSLLSNFIDYFLYLYVYFCGYPVNSR